MALRRTTKQWNKEHEKLLSFYGVDLRHPDAGLPAFGSDIRVEELQDARIDTFRNAIGDEAGSGLVRGESTSLPTLLNLASYFHYTFWGIEALRALAQEHRGAAIDFTHLLLNAAEYQFFKDMVGPLREYLLRWHLYLYCVPATSYETDLSVGVSSFQSTGPSVLCILPQFPQIALDRGAQEAKVVQLARQVFWLVRSKLCVASRKIDREEKKELIDVITAWSRHIPAFDLIVELNKIEKNNPSLITSELRQALLPEAALDLLRLPAPPPEERSA